MGYMMVFLGGVWLVVLLCLSVGVVCSIAAVFTAAVLVVCIAWDWRVDVYMSSVCVCSVGCALCNGVLYGGGIGIDGGQGWTVELLVVFFQLISDKLDSTRVVPTKTRTTTIISDQIK